MTERGARSAGRTCCVSPTSGARAITSDSIASHSAFGSARPWPTEYSGMRRLAVVALAVVLDGELPVAPDRVVLPVRDLRAVEA